MDQWNEKRQTGRNNIQVCWMAVVGNPSLLKAAFFPDHDRTSLTIFKLLFVSTKTDDFVLNTRREKETSLFPPRQFFQHSLMNGSGTSGGLEERKRTVDWPKKGGNKAATTTESKTEWRDSDWCLSALADSLIKPINLYAEEMSNANRPNQAGQNGFVRKLWK